MENNTARTFVLVGIIVSVLLFMHLLPQLSVAGTALRPVNMLSDVVPEVYGDDGGQGGLLQQEAPLPLLAKVKAEEEEKKEAEKPKRPKRPVPKDMTPVIDFSNGGIHGMEGFYQALDKRKELGRPVRIAYYGDSFIEGDILTCQLRELLQQKFGGSGAGWVDCGKTTNAGRPTIRQTTSGFVSHSTMERKSFQSARQGISQRYFTLEGSAQLTLSGTSWKPHNAQWEQASLYFVTNGGMTIKGMPNGQEGQTFQPGASEEVQAVTVSDSMKQVKWTVGGAGAGDVFFGAVVEGRGGITLDNFAMRGCSGLSLASIPEATLRSFAQVRPYDLIIIHYGLNAAGPSSTDKSLNHYTTQMSKAIALFKRCFPEAAILVVGVSDRGQRAAGGVQTMKGIELMLSHQKQMAQEEGVAFFSMFDAMGGRNAMAEFVKKGWAGKDYTHIGMKAGDHLGQKLYEAIVFGYE